MNITDRLKELTEELEEAISYEDWEMVEDIRSELLLVIQDMDTDFPIEEYDFS